MSQTATTGPAMPSTTRRAGNSIKRLIGSTGPLMVLLILGVILWITAPAFRSPTSIMLLALEAAAIGVVAAGQTFVILTGGIDLSVEAMVSFSGVMAAILIAGTRIAGGQIANGIASWQAILIAVTAGALIGMFQGLLITKLCMNPLIVTLGFRSILLGLALVGRGRGHRYPERPLPELPDQRNRHRQWRQQDQGSHALSTLFARILHLLVRAAADQARTLHLCHGRQRNRHPAFGHQR